SRGCDVHWPRHPRHPCHGRLNREQAYR
ncbi:unnamed protein product, partial [Tetraodon nigroviridis]